MIPNLTHNALQNGFGHFGVASKNNKTRHVDTLGVTINSSNSLLTCFVIKSDCKEILDYLSAYGFSDIKYEIFTRDDNDEITNMEKTLALSCRL